MNPKQLRQIWEKTGGHCHFCGDPLEFDKYAGKEADGRWVLNRIAQKNKRDSDSVENCLAACARCSGLRWHRSGEELQELLYLGIIAKKEITNSTTVGKMLVQLREKRLAENESRRVSARTTSTVTASDEGETDGL
ncbi:MAG: hypothetical protein IT328_21085 [Caldilineaceae bacterium]|nr:hypothetical protein [Caldilineaceae bacterium]